jgi:hypothetical protein
MSQFTSPQLQPTRALRRIGQRGVRLRIGKVVHVGVGHTLYNREDETAMPLAFRGKTENMDRINVIPVRVAELDDVLTYHARLSDLNDRDLGWFHLDQYRFYKTIAA